MFQHMFSMRVCIVNSIERFYTNIVNALVSAGVVSIPTIPQNTLKPFWNADLDELKRQSVDIHDLWKSLGRPRMGPINTARLKSKAEYKCAIMRAAVEYENSHFSIYFVQNQVGLQSQNTNEQDNQAQHALTAARCKGP